MVDFFLRVVGMFGYVWGVDLCVCFRAASFIRFADAVVITVRCRNQVAYLSLA